MPTQPPKKLSVLIVHHAPLMRLALTTLIKQSSKFRVLGETAEAPRARQLFAEKRPAIVVLSLTLLHGDGLSLLKDFKKMNAAVRSLVVTARHDSLSVQRAFKAGARGYVVAEDETADVLHALECVADGELYASGTIARGLLQMLASGAVETSRDSCAQLSDRELQVFRLIGSGYGTSRVAGELQLSVKTVETHRQHIKEKLGLTNGVELTQRAVEWLLQATQDRIHSSSRPRHVGRKR